MLVGSIKPDAMRCQLARGDSRSVTRQTSPSRVVTKAVPSRKNAMSVGRIARSCGAQFGKASSRTRIGPCLLSAATLLASRGAKLGNIAALLAGTCCATMGELPLENVTCTVRGLPGRTFSQVPCSGLEHNSTPSPATRNDGKLALLCVACRPVT